MPQFRQPPCYSAGFHFFPTELAPLPTTVKLLGKAMHLLTLPNYTPIPTLFVSFVPVVGVVRISGFVFSVKIIIFNRVVGEIPAGNRVIFQESRRGRLEL